MSLLNFLPEIYLLIVLFISLILINFRIITYRSLSAMVAACMALGLAYYLSRPDLAYFTPSIRILFSDSLSYFGKIISLACLIVFTLGFHFHRGLNYESRQTSNLFLVFFSLFTIGLFQANHLVFFLGSALGMYASATQLVLIESSGDAQWTAIFRHRALPLGLWTILLGLLFALGTHLFGSVYISDWLLSMQKHNQGDFTLFIFAFLILMVSAIPLAGLQFQGRAPQGLSVLQYCLFLGLSVFWLRIGVPFFSLSGLLSKNMAQGLLSVGLGVFALRYAWCTLRTRVHDQWYSSALPTTVVLSLFLILLNGEQSLPAFYCISISLLFTFALASHSFLDDQYNHKGPLVLSLVALIGAPPLILGEQFYRLVHDAVASGNWIAGILMMLAWFTFAVAGMQMIGKILLLRNGSQPRRSILPSETFFLVTYMVCVISLTVFRPSVVSFLNEHPALNLW